MRHVVIFERRKDPPLKRVDYRALGFEATDEDLDLIQDLCSEWNDDNHKTSVDLLPVEMAISKHNGENDFELRVGSEAGLLMAYRGKKVPTELVIKILNLEVSNQE